MFTTFEVVERLHELLWYLADAADRPAARPVRGEVEGLRDAVEAAADSPRARTSSRSSSAPTRCSAR